MSIVSMQLRKKYKILPNEARFCEAYIKLFMSKEKATIEKASRNAGMSPDYGKHILMKENVVTYLDELLEQSVLDKALEQVNNILSGKAKDEQIVVEGCGPGCSAARTMEIRAPSKVVSDCAVNMLKLKRETEHRRYMAELKRQELERDRSENIKDGELINVDTATAEALKEHKVSGFDDETDNNS